MFNVSPLLRLLSLSNELLDNNEVGLCVLEELAALDAVEAKTLVLGV